LINSFGEINLKMASGGSAYTFSAGSIPTAGGLTVQLTNRLINVQLNEVSRKIEGCSYPKVLNITTPNKSSNSQVGNSTRRSVAPTAYENLLISILYVSLTHRLNDSTAH